MPAWCNKCTAVEFSTKIEEYKFSVSDTYTYSQKHSYIYIYTPRNSVVRRKNLLQQFSRALCNLIKSCSARLLHIPVSAFLHNLAIKVRTYIHLHWFTHIHTHRDRA